MMTSSSGRKPIKKSIKIEVTNEEHQYISQLASEMSVSIRRYVTMKTLDDASGSDMRCRKIMQLMPEFYGLAEQVEDMHTRHELIAIGGAICRCLK